MRVFGNICHDCRTSTALSSDAYVELCPLHAAAGDCIGWMSQVLEWSRGAHMKGGDSFLPTSLDTIGHALLDKASGKQPEVIDLSCRKPGDNIIER